METGMVYQDNHTNHQLVKCVIVGDTGVGKTRLICARACRTTYTLNQLIQTHVPTVWAIDHYRKDKTVYDQSWCTVDGVCVSLQLWDTFGYHDKDRKFAYGKADVVLVCFSTVRPRSLRNILHHWVPEIRHHTGGTPIILCGTQIDLRYLYKDPEFLNLNKGPFFREITSEDVIPPESGHKMASDIGALHYYETSVLVPYGIDDVFENVIRVGLVYKRDKHFWSILNNSLKRVSRPHAQEPFMPPRPKIPQVIIPESSWCVDMEKLYNDHMCCDLSFRTRHGASLEAHRVIIIAALPELEELLCSKEIMQSMKKASTKAIVRSSSLSSGWDVASKLSECRGQSLDTVCLLSDDNVEDGERPDHMEAVMPPSLTLLEHKVFHSVERRLLPNSSRCHVTIMLNDNISMASFQHVLHFMYTWSLNADVAKSADMMAEVKRIAEMLNFSILVTCIENVVREEGYINDSLMRAARKAHQDRLKDLGMKRCKCTDVMFEVDGSTLCGHRGLLMVRSDMMACMFSNNFWESSAKVVPFPGVRKAIFIHLLQYLYTDRLIKLVTTELLELIELANRLCLPRMQALAEELIIGQLSTMIAAGQEIFEEVAALLEPAQLHNANQLAAWCLWYLSCNYVQLYKKHSKLKQGLSPENQIVLSQNRWPPVWYLKERDYYDKCQVDYERAIKSRHAYLLRRGSDDSSHHGCLGFCSRRNRKIKHQPRTKEAVCV